MKINITFVIRWDSLRRKVERCGTVVQAKVNMRFSMMCAAHIGILSGLVKYLLT